MRALRVFWEHFRVGAMAELQYRVNFFLQLLQSLLSLAAGLAVQGLVFSHTRSLNGWDSAELLAVLGVYLMVSGINWALIAPNMTRLMTDVQMGTLDFALTKPVDAQLLVSVRESRIWQGTQILTGAVVLGVAIARLDASVGAGEAAAFALALLLGAVMLYCLWLVLTTGAFWLVRVENVVELLDGVFQTGRWPVGTYPRWLRLGLTFLVPVAFAVTVPAEAITSRLDGTTLLGAAGLAAAMLAVSRWFWRLGLRHYSGASA
jgi:ABC-2 type transport system permease protein